MNTPRTEFLWGNAPLDDALIELSFSLEQDAPLALADLRASAAYARALGDCGVLSPETALRLVSTLDQMREDLVAGIWTPQGAEDIHTAIEAELIRRAGPDGERLHTGRSRNDQVATAFRMTVRDRADEVSKEAVVLQRSLVERAESEIDTICPAYTHLQRAQPVRLAHWLLAHFWALERDLRRLTAARDAASVLPLGSGAVTGHAFGLDRHRLAADLGFDRVSENSIDAVGDRDFAVEFVFASTLLASHLSRLAEDLVIWSTAEFGFVIWPDTLSTGSSLMPQKRNPDLAELVRGKAASTIGDLTALLVLLKALPTAYQRDLQEDKRPVWRSAETARLSLKAMAAAIRGIRFDRERMRSALSTDLLATEMADRLVARGIPFRQAHRTISKVTAEARKRGLSLDALLAGWGEDLPDPLRREDWVQLSPEAAVERRTGLGGTARSAVLAQIEGARALLASRS
jgi:argininosuccinate lyase